MPERRPASAEAPESLLDRRTMIIGGAVAGVGAIGGAVWLASRGGEDDPAEASEAAFATTSWPASPEANFPEQDRKSVV